MATCVVLKKCNFSSHLWTTCCNEADQTHELKLISFFLQLVNLSHILYMEYLNNQHTLALTVRFNLFTKTQKYILSKSRHNILNRVSAFISFCVSLLTIYIYLQNMFTASVSAETDARFIIHTQPMLVDLQRGVCMKVNSVQTCLSPRRMMRVPYVPHALLHATGDSS